MRRVRLALFWVVFSVWHTISTKADLHAILRNAQARINETESLCYPNHSGTKQAYLSGKWAEYLGQTETLVYPFCLHTKELGNKLGNFLTEVACADAVGLNFLSVHKSWDLIGAYTNNQTLAAVLQSAFDPSRVPTNAPTSIHISRIDPHRKAFLEALPDLVIHSNPVDKATASKRIQELCKCTRYCWGDAGAPWVNRTALIGSYVREAIKAYLRAVGPQASTTIATDTDMTNAPEVSFHLFISPQTYARA